MRGWFLALVLFAACSDPPYDGPGVVAEMRYDDPDSWVIPGYYVPGTTSCSGGYNNVPRTCTQTPGYYVPPIAMNDGPHYNLVLDKTTDDERHTISVTPEQYAECAVGDHFSPNEGGCP